MCSDATASTSTFNDTTVSSHQSEHYAICAHLLQSLDYTAILNVMTNEKFQLPIIAHCFRLPRTSATSTGARQRSDVAKAAQVFLLRKINTLTNQLPVPHQMTSCVATLGSKLSALQLQYQVQMTSLFVQPCWLAHTFQLADALQELMTSDVTLDEESERDLIKLTILCLEVSSVALPTRHDNFRSLLFIRTCFSRLSSGNSYITSLRPLITW